MSHDTLNTVLNIISIVLHLVQIYVGVLVLNKLALFMARFDGYIRSNDERTQRIETEGKAGNDARVRQIKEDVREVLREELARKDK